MRYFFDIKTPQAFTPDEIGCECLTREVMKLEAMRALASIVRDEIQTGASADYCILVKDDNRTAIFEVTAAVKTREMA